MTITEAFEVRIRFLQEHKRGSGADRSVIDNILRGEYDVYKDEGITIANEDLRFLSLSWEEQNKEIKDKLKLENNK